MPILEAGEDECKLLCCIWKLLFDSHTSNSSLRGHLQTKNFTLNVIVTLRFYPPLPPSLHAQKNAGFVQAQTKAGNYKQRF